MNNSILSIDSNDSSFVKKDTHLLLSPVTRLKLKLLASIHGKNMSQMVGELVETAFEADDIEITKPLKKKMRRIIKRWKA